MNEYQLQEKRYEGARAKEVLDNEQFQHAFEDIEKEILSTWKSSPARDAEGRENLFLMLHMLNKVRMALEYRLQTEIGRAHV